MFDFWVIVNQGSDSPVIGSWKSEWGSKMLLLVYTVSGCYVIVSTKYAKVCIDSPSELDGQVANLQ